MMSFRASLASSSGKEREEFVCGNLCVQFSLKIKMKCCESDHICVKCQSTHNKMKTNSESKRKMMIIFFTFRRSPRSSFHFLLVLLCSAGLQLELGRNYHNMRSSNVQILNTIFFFVSSFVLN